MCIIEAQIAWWKKGVNPIRNWWPCGERSPAISTNWIGKWCGRSVGPLDPGVNLCGVQSLEDYTSDIKYNALKMWPVNKPGGYIMLKLQHAHGRYNNNWNYLVLLVYIFMDICKWKDFWTFFILQSIVTILYSIGVIIILCCFY